MTPILRLCEVKHSFGGVDVLRSISLDVARGAITGLIGPNGSGKTTLFNIISGYLRPLGGTLAYDGVAIGTESVQDRCRRGLVRTFQTPKVFEQMTVLENIMVGGTRLTRTGFVQDLLRLPGSRREVEKCRAEAEIICEMFGFGRLRNEPALKLPAGQRRNLEIARAVAGKPRLLLLDEPSSGLNTEEIDSLRRQIAVLNKEGLSILLVSHDMELMSIAQNVHVLYFGEIIAKGSMSGIQRDPRVREVYLGV